MLFRRIKKIIKKNKYSLQAFCFLFSPKNKIHPDGKVSAGTSARGSLTVESAFVLPLFFLCICTLICFMDIYKLQTEKLAQLCQTAKESAMYAYATGTESDILLPSVYTYQAPISAFPLPALIITNHVKVRPWTGSSRTEGASDSSEEMVYITLSGGVYHTNSGCSYLNLSIRQIPGSSVDQLRNQSGARYHACEICSDHQSAAAAVYITNTGTRYHNQAACSGLKRSVRLVKKSALGSLRQCSRCAAG